jgi:hypothetical protein
MNLSFKINLLIGLQNQLRIFHWQTKELSKHNSFGKTYDKLGKLIDDFVEISMGKYGRFVLTDEDNTITLVNLGEVDVNDIINTCSDTLISFSDDLNPEKDTDLLNIRDEMIGLLSKLSYLLTLD